MLTEKKIILLIFKDFSADHTVTSIAEYVNLSRVGVWKILKKLESSNLITLEKIGKGKTSTYIPRLNIINPVVIKSIGLYLTEEAQEKKKWLFNFADLENEVDFLILYGSILRSKTANDIDILTVVSKKKGFISLQKKIEEMQKTQEKKIHTINLTASELIIELNKKNYAFIDAIKTGIVLFGQENFIRFINKVKS